jgi:hypothetical protein
VRTSLLRLVVCWLHAGAAGVRMVRGQPDPNSHHNQCELGSGRPLTIRPRCARCNQLVAPKCDRPLRTSAHFAPSAIRLLTVKTAARTYA